MMNYLTVIPCIVVLAFLLFTLVHAQDGCKVPVFLTAPTGSFSSPYYDLYSLGLGLTYPPYLKCRWTISAPPGMNIHVDLHNPMSIDGEGLDCPSDYLAIYPGTHPDSMEICAESRTDMIAGPYCPTEKRPVAPGSFVIGRNQIDVEFCSDESFALQGFRLTYEATSDPATPIPPPITPVCGGKVDVTAGAPQLITTPGYPEEYPTARCTWEIAGPEGFSLVFTAAKFDIEDWCEADSVSLTDLTVTGENADLGTYCGYTFPGVKSIGNRVKVYFESDTFYFHGGFEMQIEVSPCRIGAASCPTSNNEEKPVCFDPDQLCDGSRDCPDGSDEICPWGCGVPAIPPLLSSKAVGRIVGGIEARPHSWPWQVQLIGGETMRQLCGGSIIDRRWILTAASCCTVYSPKAINYRIVVGEHDIHGEGERNARTYDLERVVVHPGYDKDAYTFENNICLLKTKQPILFNNDVQPVCLAFGAEHAAGTDCYVTGWGTVDPAKHDPKFPQKVFAQDHSSVRGARPDRNNGLPEQQSRLRQVDVKITDKRACQAVYAEWQLDITDDMLCAYNPGKDRCQDDRGGPLVCRSHSDRNQWELVGVTSWGFGCARPNVPAVYADVFYFYDWIAETIMTD